MEKWMGELGMLENSPEKRKKWAELLDSFLFPQLTFNYFKKCISLEKREERDERGGGEGFIASKFFFEEVSALLKSKILLKQSRKKVDAKKKRKIKKLFPFRGNEIG